MSRSELGGRWRSRYSYHREGSYSEHELVIEDSADLNVTGHADNDDGSILDLELRHDAQNRVLTGTWRERTSPTGDYKGLVFHGAVQFILASTMDEAVGVWVGFNAEHDTINSGHWRLTKIS